MRAEGREHVRILIVGATGTIGREVVAALRDGHDLVLAARKGADVTVDIQDPQSIRAMYSSLGKVDAVVSAAGSGGWGPLAQLTDDDFARSLGYKLMGQVNLIRYGFDNMNDGGSFTVTSGILGRAPMIGSGAISLVNA